MALVSRCSEPALAGASRGSGLGVIWSQQSTLNPCGWSAVHPQSSGWSAIHPQSSRLVSNPHLFPGAGQRSTPDPRGWSATHPQSLRL
eukprot:10767-Chlamydomonas_euryale.AAC.2